MGTCSLKTEQRFTNTSYPTCRKEKQKAEVYEVCKSARGVQWVVWVGGHTRALLFKLLGLATSVRCHPVEPFQCQMVVSLKPIPRDLVETVFKVTQPFNGYHGAPVHIGDPALIGIIDIDKPEYCGPMQFHEGDVPVFWACGTTVIEALKEVKPSLAFTHYEKDAVYISDTPIKSQDSPLADIKVVTLCEKPYWASVTSEAIVEKIKQLECFISEDLGNGQLENVIHDDLLKLVLALSHASSVALTIVFPSLLNNKNLYDDYGLPGAIAIAMMLQELGKKVDLVVEKRLYEPLTAILEALVKQRVLASPLSVVQFPPEGEQDTLQMAKTFLLKAGTTAPCYDHLLAIERKGNRVGGIDWMFLAAADMPTVHTSRIQDGNTDGIGKVGDTARCDISEGSTTTACSMASDFLITTGVSNWGGYAVAVGLYLASICPIHERYRRRAVGFPPSDEDRERFGSALPDVDRERKLIDILLSHKFFNMTGKEKPHGDGLSSKNAKKIKQLLNVIELY